MEGLGSWLSDSTRGDEGPMEPAWEPFPEVRVPRILVVDDLAIFREPIEAVLRAEGFEVLTACHGQEAVAAMTATRPDLVLLDLAMPVMDGLAVLRHMRQDRSLCGVPVLVLSADAERDHIVEAVRLGVSGYLLKAKFSLADMLARVRTILEAESGLPEPGELMEASPEAEAAGEAREAPAIEGSSGAGGVEVTDVKDLKPIVTRSDLMARLRDSEELKGFSPTVAQVLKVAMSTSASLEAVSRAVRQDQAIALKVLKIANSSVYSRGDRVDTVHNAILRIGMENIRQTVLNIAVVERFSSLAFREHLSTEHFWEHSIACGIIAAELAHALGGKEPDSAFTCGLLHDLGRVIFAEALGEAYVRVIETARRLEVPLEQVETRMLLLSHADAMDRLLVAWKFPRHLVDPILHHHLSAGNARSVASSRVGDVLRLGLANRLAHAMLLGTSGNETIYPTEEHCRALGVAPKVIAQIEETARRQTDDTKFALLTSSNAATWPRRADELRARFASPMRPLFVSAAPEFDAFRIFTRELTGPSDGEPPNLAVVHLAAARDREAVGEALLLAEKECGPLPAIVLSPAGQVALPESAAKGRRLERLATPVAVARFIRAANSLLAAETLKAAA